MISKVIAALRAHGQTVVVAESCTGGRLAAEFTSLAGSSEYFLGGVVAYANEVKTSVLGVSRETLERFGAVSAQTAREMALGVRALTGADWAVATTGIAGPGGGTAQKPVGTLWVAVAGPGDLEITRSAHLSGSTRRENMSLAVESALGLLGEAMAG